MPTVEIKLPELGEGIESGDVLNVLVAEGDRIQVDQGIIEIETDKATADVPSPHAGTVRRIHVAAGQTVKVGQVLVSLEAESAAPADSTKATSAPVAPPEVAQPRPDTTNEPSPESATAQPKSTTSPAGGSDTAASEAASQPPMSGDEALAAGPAVRRLAREVGVDLAQVPGTGPGGRITRDDVLEMVRHTNRAREEAVPVTEATPPTGSPGAVTPPGEESTDAWGKVRIERMTRIRRTIAERMHQSWTTIPRVTNFDDADITELENIRQKSKEDYAATGVKLTTLPFIIKAVATALRGHPVVNASIDFEAGQIIYKEYVNIGIAVDTERGLIVPSLRSADRLGVPEIARELALLAEKVRNNRFTVEELRGSTFTISNLGAVGGTYSTPIINPPEAAVLLIGRARRMPVAVGEEVAVRLVLPLNLSYDHRLVDGAAAARFLNEVKGYLESPGRLLLAP